MLIENSFRIPVSVSEAWTLLTDLERVVPCVPGAALDEIVEGEHRGTMTARIGPVTARYRGAAWFVERDEVDHRATIELTGREQRGTGRVSAEIRTELDEVEGVTEVSVAMDLNVSGRAAQFGRGILQEVSTKLFGEFAACLEQLAVSGGDERPAGSPANGHDKRSAVSRPESLNVLSSVGPAVLRRTAPILLAAGVGALIGWVAGWRRGLMWTARYTGSGGHDDS